YAFGNVLEVIHREAALRLRERHGAARAVAATHKAFRVAFAANDVRAGSHAAGNDTHVAFASTDSAFASDQNVLVVMAFAGHIVVVAVDGLQLGNQRAHLTRITDRKSVVEGKWRNTSRRSI